MYLGKPMSQETQNDFERLVVDYFQRHRTELRLTDPTFKRDGFIIMATMMGTGGRVEIRCGPAEYHAEVFIIDQDNKRWTLTDLLNVNAVRTWMMQNRPSILGRSPLEAEIDCALCLLAVGLKGVSGFEWLYGSA